MRFARALPVILAASLLTCTPEAQSGQPVKAKTFKLATPTNFTVPSQTRAWARETICVEPSGDAMIAVRITDAAGNRVDRFSIRVPADGTAIKDTISGTVMAASVPAGLASAITTFISQMDTALANAVAAGKFNR